MRKGAYSNKYKAIEAERIDSLKNERKDEVKFYKEIERNLARETNRRRRFIKEKKRSFLDLEQARRQRALETRRKRQLEATTKFQRQPVARPKYESAKNEVVPVLTDGVYNIRGHIVEIKDGIRVSSVSSQSSNQHMRNSSTSEKSKTYNVMNGQYGSHSKNSIYSGREYLLHHLNDLSHGNDKKSLHDEITSPDQGIVNDDVKFSELQNQNLVPNDSNGSSFHAPNETPENETSVAHDKCMPTQNLATIVVGEGGLDPGKLSDDQAKLAELGRKSSMKRQQPPGSPTKEKRKVKFNRSIEFNDGLVWMLKDTEEKPRSGGIKSIVPSPASDVGKEIVAIPVPKQASLSNAATPLKDFSYPETVDLGLPAKRDATKEDFQRNVEMESDVKTTATGDVDANISNHPCDAFERDSLELSDNDTGKPDMVTVEQQDKQTVLVESQSKSHSLPDYSSKDINDNYKKDENDKKDMGTKDTLVQHVVTSKDLRRETVPLASFTENTISMGSGNMEYERSAKDTSGRVNVPHYNITRGDISSRGMYKLIHPEKATHSQELSEEQFGHGGRTDLRVTALNSMNLNVRRPHSSVSTVTNDVDYKPRPISSSATSYVHQIDAKSSARVNPTSSGSQYQTSRNPYASKYDHTCFVPVQYHGNDDKNISQPSFVQSRHFQGQTRQVEPENMGNTNPIQHGNNFNAPSSYSAPKSILTQDRNIALYEKQSVLGSQHREISDTSDTSKLLMHQSETLRHHAETLRNRAHLAEEQQKILSDESPTFREQSYRDALLTGNNPASAVQYKSKILQDSGPAGKDLSVIDNEQGRKQKPGTSLGRGTYFAQDINYPSDDSDDEDEVIKKVRKSMAELQFNSNWRPDSAAKDYNIVSQVTNAEEIPRPSIKNKIVHPELVDDADKIKAQSKLAETSEKRSNIPIRVQSAPNSGSPKQNKIVKTPQKAGIVPHPPTGPKGLFTRKMIRQGAQNRRNSPMRVTKPHANASQVTQNAGNSAADSRLFTVEGSAAMRTQSGTKGLVKTDSRDTSVQRNYQEDFGNMTSQGDTRVIINSALNKTPTDDEIDDLWHNVRNCLTIQPPAKASSDSVYIVPPWKQHRTWSGTVRGRSNTNHQVSLYSVSGRKGYPLRRYGSHDNLIRRESSLDNLAVNSNPRGRSAVLMKHSSRPKINTNYQAFTAKDSSSHKPFKSEKAPDVSKAKPKDMSESLASFLALEAMCEQESLSPHRTSAVLKASQNVQYQMQREKINSPQQQLAITRRQEPSALSIEERKVMESLERLNTRLREKESEARKYEANSAWNQKMTNGILQETSRTSATNGNKFPKNHPPRRDSRAQQHPAYRY